MKLKDNVILTQHQIGYAQLDLETLRTMKEKINKYDVICFETELGKQLELQPELMQLLDHYLYKECEILGKEIKWFTEYEVELARCIKYMEEIQSIGLTEEEIQKLNTKEREYLNRLLNRTTKKDFTKKELFEAHKEFTEELNEKLLKKMDDMFKRDQSWDLSDESVLYVFGASHGVNLDIWE
ncbi:MAG: hypothetical protein ACRC1M_02400 [Methanobacteriaceae archaeon]